MIFKVTIRSFLSIFFFSKSDLPKTFQCPFKIRVIWSCPDLPKTFQCPFKIRVIRSCPVFGVIFNQYFTQSNKCLFLLKGSKYEICEEDVNEYEKIMRLTIKSWQKADESHFTCISTNSLGKADGKIQAYSKFRL